MRYLIKINNKKLFYFNCILFCLLLILFMNPFLSKKMISKYTDYTVEFTYFYPGDATGSTDTLHSGLKASDFTVGENGWYFYNGYLVIAAATTNCRDSANHCGVSSSHNGYATSIPYYNLYDTLTLNLGGKTYNAMVLDSCGACMWGDRDYRGEKFDIFSTKGGTNPGVYNNTSSIISNNGAGEVTNPTDIPSYVGDLKQGYIYQNQEYGALYPYRDNDNIIKQKIDNVIYKIFSNAMTNYTGDLSGNYEIVIPGGAGEASGWKQYDSNWSSIKLGNTSTTIKGAGCLVTSVAIQIQLSGTHVTTDNFNPGTFVEVLRNNGGFQGALFTWTGWQSIAPNWVYAGKYSLPSSKQGKINQLKQWLDQGYYPVMCAKTSCGHWVAVTGASDTDIQISDPGSSSTSLFTRYKVENDSTLKVGLFRKTD